MKFPDVSGKNLLGESFNLPHDFAGDLNLVFVAFTEWQQPMVDSWVETADALEAQYSNLRYYEVPTIFPMNLFQMKWLDSVMRAGIQDAATRARTITVHVEIANFLHQLELPGNRTIYPLLLSASGDVLWQTAGVYSDTAAQDLRDVIRKTGIAQFRSDFVRLN
jgi:hypothetical protein